MRTLLVAVLVSLAAATPVGAAPLLDPVGLSADHTADCSGITIVTEGWPDGSSGVLGINGVGYTIPMNSTGTWTTSGTYSYAIRFTVPGQVPSAEGATITCEAPSVESQSVVELELPATM